MKTALAFILVAMLPANALASLPAGQCDLSSASPDACGVSKVTVEDASAAIVAARSDAHTQASTAINAYGYCKFVQNASDYSFFIPFRTKVEWVAFLNNLPAGVTVVDCAQITVAAVVPPTSLIIDEGRSDNGGDMVGGCQ